ncbi:MAG: hypothetical protein E7313_05620 [Clostridiales bacterium]|nr:hypothetical protein [Clostridiales bacterium]
MHKLKALGLYTHTHTHTSILSLNNNVAKIAAFMCVVSQNVKIVLCNFIKIENKWFYELE